MGIFLDNAHIKRMDNDLMTIEIPGPLRSADAENRRKKAESVVNIGLFFNAALAIVKVCAGITGHSQALLADGVNSISDVVYFVVVKIFVRLSAKLADSEHPYGHHQLESIAALVVGAFVIATGAAIFWDSVNTTFDLLTGAVEPRQIRAFALGAAVATIVVKVALMLHASDKSKETGSLVIKALAQDHRNDIVASAGAAAGILFSMLGASWVDPVAGAIVAAVVAKTGFDILREASSDLMDNVPSEEISQSIRELLDGIAAVKSIEDVHAHRFGPYLVVNLTIGIDGALSVRVGDEIADNVESDLLSGIEMLCKVYVHCHPARIGEASMVRKQGQ